MAFASSSTSSTLRAVVRPRSGAGRRARIIRNVPNRNYSAAAALAPEPIPDSLPGPSTSPSTSQPPHPVLSPTTPSSAQSYLSDLLHLPPTHAFSPPLSLQILTHKSYRFAHPIRRSSSPTRWNNLGTRIDSLSAHSSPEEIEAACAPHNARLSFLGRRALETYLAVFIHDLLKSSRNSGLKPSLDVQGEEWLRGKSLSDRLDDIRHVNNLGREIGNRWGIGDVMRWDRNETSREGGHVKIKGLTVEAVLGGVFTQLGGPAAQRTFHLHVLPYLVGQFRDARIKERAEEIKKGVERDYKSGIINT